MLARLSSLLPLALATLFGFASAAGAQDDYTLFESGHVRPMAMSPDGVWLYAGPDLGWDARAALVPLGPRAAVAGSTQAIVDAVADIARPGDHVLVMSNGGFEGIHQRLLDALAERAG